MNEQELKQTTTELEATKAEAREISVRAIRTLVARLAEALDGATLKGLPNLGASSSKPWRGARVRGSGGRRARADDIDFLATPLARPAGGETYGKAAICINHRGELVSAQLDCHGDVRESPVHDDDLFAEDAERLASALAGVLHQHIRRSKRSTQRFANIRAFSDRVLRILSLPAEDR